MEILIYISYEDRQNSLSVGVYKKILSQCNVFRNYYKTLLICRENSSIIVKNINYNKEEQINDIFYSIGNYGDKFIKYKKYKNLNIFNKFIDNYIRINKPKVIYIRKYNLLNTGIYYIKNAKKKLNCNIIYEIPTYPYGQEFKKNGKYLVYLLNKVIDKCMEKNADIIPVVLGKEVKFNSKKYIPIFNGIDIKNVDIRRKNNHNKNIINLVGVANVSFWHGYDRIIEGVENYYSKVVQEEVYFHIVGEGTELKKLKTLVEQYNLNKYIIFHGLKTGKELDEIVNLCEIGIGSLANHRKGLIKDSSLKNREYCARGIPFIIASEDDAFKSFKYVYKIPADNSFVNINEIIKFYNSIKNENYILEMRNYAKQNLTWEVVMEPVIKLINDSLLNKN